MSYTKQEFKSGEKLYAAQLNAMDEQIAANEKNVGEHDDLLGLDSEYLKNVLVFPDSEHIKTGGLIYSNGGFLASGTYDSVQYLPVEPEDGTEINVHCTIHGNTTLAFCGVDKNVIGFVNGSNCADYGITADLAPKEYEIIPPNGTKYISYSVYTTYGAVISEKGVGYKAKEYSDGLLGSVAALEDANIPDVVNLTPNEGYLRSGGMITKAGNFVESQNYDSIYMLPIWANKNTNVSVYATIYGTACVVFYDSNKNVIRFISTANAKYLGITGQLEPKTYNIPAPLGTRYISYTVFTAYGAKILEHPVISEVNANTYTTDIISCVSLVTPKFSDVRQMKTLVMGDSISTDMYGNYKKWVTNLIDADFFSYANVTNNSIHATGFVARLSDTEDDSFLARIKAIENPADYDLVVVFGGINDSIQGIPHGTDEDTDTTTYFKPAVKEFFAYLTENFINARIAVLLPLRTYSYPYSATQDHRQYEYGEYIAEVAKEYALPVLDLTNKSGFRPHILSYRNRWTLIPEGYTGTDGVHPNAEYCKDYLAPMIRDFLNSIL